MNRRSFLTQIGATCGAFSLQPRRTRHVVLIVSSGLRKRDYYGQAALASNIGRLAREGFVFEEDHCERVGSHDAAFAELLQGREFNSRSCSSPTLIDYIGNGVQVRSIRDIPRMMQWRRPRILVCREQTHDIGHESYEGYLRAVRNTDSEIAGLFNWVTRHPDFRRNTAIVIRPEFGRDDEVNEHGHLHHSYGFYYTHRVASIFWGPDFNRGVDKQTVIRSVDMAPTLTRLFGVEATYAEGRVVPGLFKQEVQSI